MDLVIPPSTLIFWPVIYSQFLDANKLTTEEISLTFPTLLSGTLFINSFFGFKLSINPGRILLILILNFANSCD